MKPKKALPTRRCVACGKEGEKGDFVRVVRSSDGVISVDAAPKAQGRGAYICPTRECLAMAKKKNAFARSLKTAVDSTVYDELARKICGI